MGGLGCSSCPSSHHKQSSKEGIDHHNSPQLQEGGEEKGRVKGREENRGIESSLMA